MRKSAEAWSTESDLTKVGVRATKSYAYDGLGRTVKSTDPNGTVHEYAYDVVGRFRSDAVTTFGSGVDQAVKRLETAYDSAGRGLPHEWRARS